MTLMLFRSARESDIDAIHQLAVNSGIGITTLPKELSLLKKRIAWSTASFNKAVDSPHNEYYLFVLECAESGKIVGTSAIEAAIGQDDIPFYSYKLSQKTRICHELNIRNDYEILSLVNDNQGLSEMCTLFLDPSYRNNNNGSLLSRSRFLFIAQYPERFAASVIAELRGVTDEEGRSPFWEQIGYHFFKMPFVEADRLTLATNKQFIADLMPRHPIYIKLLSPAAQAVIGKPHPSSLPAMNILIHEGFHYNKYIDIFDGGPTIEVPRDQIKTIAASRILTINDIVDEVSSKNYLIATIGLDFRATISQVIFNEQSSACVISHDTAQLLQVNLGDDIRVSALQLTDGTNFNKERHDA